MVEENVTDGKSAEQTTQENTANTLESELAKLKSDIAAKQAEIDAAKHEALAEKQNVSKKEKQLQEIRNQQTKLDSLEKKFDVLTEMVADLVDRGEVEEEPQPKRRRSEEYINRLKTKPEEPKKAELPEEFVKSASEADALARSVGLGVDTSDELLKAYKFFMQGKGDEGLAEVKRVVEQTRKVKESPKKITIKDLPEEEVEELRKQAMEKEGTLVSDAGKPASKGLSRADAYAKYARGEMSEADARKHGLF